MKKAVLITITLLMTIAISASDVKNPDSKHRLDALCKLYNQDLNDSLIHQAPRDLEFHKQQEDWECYYETWMHLVNTYNFMGKVNTGLREARQMHADATQRKDHYGQALAEYVMGNAYLNMGYYDEAIGCYRQSLTLINETGASHTTLNDIYSYYCDALNELKRWKDMQDVTEQWKLAIDKIAAEAKDGGRDYQEKISIWYSYYYLARAQQHLGLSMLSDAKKDIDEAEKYQNSEQTFTSLSILYYRAQYFLQAHDYQKAYEYNTRQLKESRHIEDMTSDRLIYLQRSEIMKGLGRHEEALEMLQQAYELSDSIYKKDARTQINELSTLFQVNELNMEHRMQRARNAIAIIAVIVAAMFILLGYGYWMNRRLRRKNEELAVARDQAQESLRMKSDFIKNISHEIRTPLNILSGFSQIMSTQGADMPAKERLQLSNGIQENTNRITHLINQLLELSETHSRNHIERTDTISANQLCHTAIATSGVSEDHHHQFTFDSTLDDSLTITTSERDAIQAIDHLIDNARKFTPAGGRISMRCRRQDKMLEISIEDTGCGIPAEKADTIFEEFVQLDDFQTGVGIGLPLSRSIVRRLGGDITLDTTYHPGARFVLTLPL